MSEAHLPSPNVPETRKYKQRSKKLVVVDLLTFTATHRWRLGALVVDIRPEVLIEGNWRRLRLFYSLVDLGLRLFVEFLGVTW